MFRKAILVLKRIYKRFRDAYRKRFRQQNFIFQHKGPFSSERRTDCVIKSFRSKADVPESVKADLLRNGGKKTWEINEMEIDENAVFWVAFKDKHVVSTVFTRRGMCYKNWFLPLNPEDVVVFRLGTFPEFRGRGFAPSLIRQAIYETLKDSSGHAYIDCRTYNKSSINCIKKVGFNCIAKMKTISRDWALYG